MAMLFHESKPVDTYSLEVNPLRLTAGGADDGYEATLREKDQVLFSGVSAGHNGEMGHYYLATTGEAFRNARTVIDARIAFDNEFGQPCEKQVAVQVGTPFVEIYLTGHRNEDEEWIDIDLFFCPDWSQEPEGLVTPYLRAFLRTSVKSAEQFGTELIQQLREVEAEGSGSASNEENDASGCP
jgi:hypothetical protein